MKEKCKRIVSFLLVLMMLMTFMPQICLVANAAEEQWDVINMNGVTGEDIVKQARKYIGVPYKSGDYKTRTGYTSPQRFDCSGLVYRVCREVGLASTHENSTMGVYDDEGKPLEGKNSAGYYYITAHTNRQRNYGKKLSEAVALYKSKKDYSGFKPGDLLFFAYNGGSTTNHVGIYCGNGRIINATSSKGVVETPLSQTGWPDGTLGASLFDAVRLITCEHPSYKGCGICKSCGTSFDWESTLNAADAGKYQVTKKTTLRSAPYEDAEALTEVKKDTKVEVLGNCTNAYGNKWYKIKIGNHIYYGYSGHFKFLEHSALKVQCTGFSPANNAVLERKAYPIIGTVTSNYPLKSIAAYIDGVKYASWTATDKNTTTVSLRDTAINTGLKFSELSDGKHTIILKAWDYIHSNGVQFHSSVFYIEKPSCSHNWDSGQVTKAATCKEAGVKTYTCTTCKATKTETIAKASSHNYSAWVNAWWANNTTHLRICSVCQKEETASHTWDSGKVTKAATCKEAGVKTYTCTTCKATKTETIAKLTTHTYDNDCDPNCNICDEVRAAGHNFKWVGNREGHYLQCTICEGFQDPVDHEWHLITPNDETLLKNHHWYGCDICLFAKKEEHAYDDGVVTKKPTCKDTGIKTYTCSICGVTKTEAIAKLTTHTYNADVVTKQPTCKETDVKTYTCTVCGVTKTETIAKLTTHTYGKWTKVNDTTHKHTCTVCGKEESASHTWDSGKVTKAATCKEAGIKTYTCTTCKATKTETIAKTNHSWSDATCTKPKTCKTCGATSGTKLGHNYSNGVCTRCNGADPDYVEAKGKYSVTNITATAGKTVEVYISISQNPGIISLRNTVSYDTSALELIEVVNTGLLKGYTTPAAAITSPYTLRWADSLATKNNTANGNIVKLVFKVKENTDAGSYKVTVSPVEARDVSGAKVNFAAATGSVTVIDCLIGDTDGDGEVSDWDAIVINRYLAGWQVELGSAAADVDGDGELSDWDAIVLERYLAGWDVKLGG